MEKTSALDQTLSQRASRALEPIHDSGWLAGFRNILGKELADWFGTRRWLIQTVLWVVIINVGIGLVLFLGPMASPEAGANHAAELYGMGLSVLFNTLILLGSIGIIILTQDEIIQEKQSGTAAWILTKPVSRVSFLLSKLISNFTGAVIFIVTIPCLIAYVQIRLASGQSAPLLPYLAAMGIAMLTLTFYTTLTLMLGTFFEQRAPVLGGAFGVLFGGLILAQSLPALKLGNILPVTMDRVALTILQGQPLPSAMIFEVITAAFFSVLFIVAAVWRFSEEEF